MENASKALLIAATVLVVILIIAFGMQIMNSSSGTTEQVSSTMSSSEAQAFNSQFTGYRGTQKGSAVRNLLIAVAQSNTANPSHNVTVTGTSTLAGVVDTRVYTVTLTYDEGTGYITGIAVN